MLIGSGGSYVDVNTLSILTVPVVGGNGGLDVGYKRMLTDLVAKFFHLRQPQYAVIVPSKSVILSSIASWFLVLFDRTVIHSHNEFEFSSP